MSKNDPSHDTATGAPASERDAVPHYEIRVTGHLESRWSAWFDGLTVEADSTDGTTAIRGPVVDQAALHGLLQKLRDVGMPLVSLTPLNTSTEPTARPHRKES